MDSSAAKILPAPKDGRTFFITTTKNTDMSQRATLEEVIVNLATAAGAEFVYKRYDSRGVCFYEVQQSRFAGYQSASNTILELSRLMLSRASRAV